MKPKEEILSNTLAAHNTFIVGAKRRKAILEAMELYRNQPSGEGVKEPEEYWEEFSQSTPAYISFRDHGKTVGLKALTAQALDMGVKLFDPKKNRPKQNPDDITFSETVFIIDEEGMHGLAFFSFSDDKWIFLTDTLVDYYEPGNETEWRWYYPPVAGFRNDRSKPKDHEIEHECATCHKDISKWGFCPDCDTQANSR